MVIILITVYACVVSQLPRRNHEHDIKREEMGRSSDYVRLFHHLWMWSEAIHATWEDHKRSGTSSHRNGDPAIGIRSAD